MLICMVLWVLCSRCQHGDERGEEGGLCADPRREVCVAGLVDRDRGDIKGAGDQAWG